MNISQNVRAARPPVDIGDKLRGMRACKIRVANMKLVSGPAASEAAAEGSKETLRSDPGVSAEPSKTLSVSSGMLIWQGKPRSSSAMGG